MICFFGRTPRNLFRVSVLFQATWLLIKNASRQIDSEVLRHQEKKGKKESLATYALLQLNGST